MVRTLCYSVLSSILVLGVLAGGAGQAEAQGGPPPAPTSAPPPPPPPYAAPGAMPPPGTVVYRPAPEFLRWGIGVHLGGMGVAPEGDDTGERQTDLGLVGLQLRFRLHRRWELELDFSYMEGELPDLGETRRSSGAVILGGMFHINPHSRWLWSVLFGVGGTRDRIWYEKQDERVTVAEFAGGLGRLGIGLERRFERWGLAAQLYGVGMSRDEEELDGPAYAGREGPVPERSSGGLFQLVANYYF
jgi:hypothetical protein